MAPDHPSPTTPDAPLASFATPWRRSLLWLTALSLTILVGVALVAALAGPDGNPWWVLAVLVPALGALTAAAFFTIRRYDVTANVLLVRRLGWTTRVDLTGLRSVEADPDAMSNAQRTHGRGQLAWFFNTYANERLGDFRAYGHQERHAVVLRYDDAVVVVTPNDPRRMVTTLQRMIERRSSAAAE